MSEDKRSQTHTTGEVYVHPRGKGYRDNFDGIFDNDPELDIDDCKDCEGCQCSENLSGESS